MGVVLNKLSRTTPITTKITTLKPRLIAVFASFLDEASLIFSSSWLLLLAAIGVITSLGTRYSLTSVRLRFETGWMLKLLENARDKLSISLPGRGERFLRWAGAVSDVIRK